MSEKEISQEDLTKLMVFFGRIPETHIQNLKNFPFIFFDGVTEAKIDHDVKMNKVEKSLIVYDLTLNKDNDNLDKRYQALLSAVRYLFWKEIQIKVTINGQEVYLSE